MIKIKSIVGVLIGLLIIGAAYLGTKNKSPHTLPPSVASPAVSSSTLCQSENLRATLSDPSGAAGTYYYTLNLKNDGLTECVYSGSTTIALQDGNNTPLARVSVATPNLTIAAGHTLYGPVAFPDANNYTGSDTCIAGITTLAVYPPGQTMAVSVTNIDELQPWFTNYACPGFSVQSLGSLK